MSDVVDFEYNDEGDVTLLTSLRGSDLMSHAPLNKGTAFNLEERISLGLLGRLPDRVETLDEQIERCYAQFNEKPTDMGKNIYLNSLHDINEVLFYELVRRYMVEMLPIVYTPTVGLAVQQYSLEFRRVRGLFLCYQARGRISEMLKNRANKNIDLILVTDGEGVLGIGDQGIGGMDIAVAKLMVYTLCAGIPPARVLPIQLDVGTNNEKLLKDPLYLGWRSPRISSEEYDVFIDEFVSAVKENFPGAYLHWEDFGRENARRYLQRYRQALPTFNDDMQGTGATVLACILAAIKGLGSSLLDQRIIVFGAGTAGVGIADQIMTAMVASGCSKEDAYRRFWLIDRPGLLLQRMDCLTDFQKPYARPFDEKLAGASNEEGPYHLYDVVRAIKPTILIGCSGVSGAFNESVVKEMAAGVPRPIILPLSNPTPLAEAVPADLIEWTQGAVLLATGSPFLPVQYDGRNISIAQANNAFVFPGLGLGVIVAKVSEVTDALIRTAADTLSEHAPVASDIDAPLLPNLSDIERVSKHIAIAVARKAVAEGLSTVTDIEEKIDKYFWVSRYLPFKFIDQ